jgi:hypothetical protein
LSRRAYPLISFHTPLPDPHPPNPPRPAPSTNRQPTGRLAAPDASSLELTLHALQFASSMLTRDKQGRRTRPAAIGFQVGSLADAGWRGGQSSDDASLNDEMMSSDRPSAAGRDDHGEGERTAARLAAVAAAAAAAGSSRGGAGSGNGSSEGLAFRLMRVDAEAARRAANTAPIFSVRDTDSPKSRGAELAKALLKGVEGGAALAVVIKCWGRSAMPVAARVSLLSRGWHVDCHWVVTATDSCVCEVVLLLAVPQANSRRLELHPILNLNQLNVKPLNPDAPRRPRRDAVQGARSGLSL